MRLLAMQDIVNSEFAYIAGMATGDFGVSNTSYSPQRLMQSIQIAYDDLASDVSVRRSRLLDAYHDFTLPTDGVVAGGETSVAVPARVMDIISVDAWDGRFSGRLAAADVAQRYDGFRNAGMDYRFDHRGAHGGRKLVFTDAPSGSFRIWFQRVPGSLCYGAGPTIADVDGSTFTVTVTDPTAGNLAMDDDAYRDDTLVIYEGSARAAYFITAYDASAKQFTVEGDYSAVPGSTARQWSIASFLPLPDQSLLVYGAVYRHLNYIPEKAMAAKMMYDEQFRKFVERNVHDDAATARRVLQTRPGLAMPHSEGMSDGRFGGRG